MIFTALTAQNNVVNYKKDFEDSWLAIGTAFTYLKADTLSMSAITNLITQPQCTFAEYMYAKFIFLEILSYFVSRLYNSCR